jgi:DNA-binding transcriptional regulator GbsR (MarR family)
MMPQGQTFDPVLDGPRLEKQSGRVFEFVKSGHWLTLREISDATGDPEASVSARLRDLRRLGLTVHRRRRGDPKKGLFEYSVQAFEWDQHGQGFLPIKTA